MSHFHKKKKITKYVKRQDKQQSKETKQVSESDSDMTYILELSDREFK